MDTISLDFEKYDFQPWLLILLSRTFTISSAILSSVCLSYAVDDS